MTCVHSTVAVLQAGLLAGIAAGCDRLQAVLCPAQRMKRRSPRQPRRPAPAPRSDQEIANDIQNRINGESALSGQNIQVSVNGGTATLNGTVNNDAARALAAADSGAATGVRTVINNLTVAPEQRTKAGSAPKPERAGNGTREQHRQQQAMTQPAPPPPRCRRAGRATGCASPPPRPPAPVARTVSVAGGHLAAGADLADALDSGTTQTGPDHSRHAGSGHHRRQHGGHPARHTGDGARDGGEGCDALFRQLAPIDRADADRTEWAAGSGEHHRVQPAGQGPRQEHGDEDRRRRGAGRDHRRTGRRRQGCGDRRGFGRRNWARA